VEAWAVIPVVAIVMWGLVGIARAVRGLPDLPSHHRSRGHRGLEADQVAQPDESVRAELEELRRRMTELEERQDFAERLLARQDRSNLSPGRQDAL
jgi:hypothetical protein